MGLTLEIEQNLERVSLVELFNTHRGRWEAMGRKSHDFVRKSFPDGASIRPDDVAKALLPLLEVDETLSNKLAQKKLKQKYWVRNFCDLILDRCWTTYTKEAKERIK